MKLMLTLAAVSMLAGCSGVAQPNPWESTTMRQIEKEWRDETGRGPRSYIGTQVPILKELISAKLAPNQINDLITSLATMPPREQTGQKDFGIALVAFGQEYCVAHRDTALLVKLLARHGPQALVLEAKIEYGGLASVPLLVQAYRESKRAEVHAGIVTVLRCEFARRDYDADDEHILSFCSHWYSQNRQRAELNGGYAGQFTPNRRSTSDIDPPREGLFILDGKKMTE
jgi:hypothetical protein